MKFALKDIYKGHFNTTYKGIPVLKCPFDYMLYQMLVWQVKPDLIIEIGTLKGGSALYLADLLKLNGNGVIHTIDLPSNNESHLLHEHPNIKVFKEGFREYDIQQVRQFEKIMVIEDGSHEFQDCLDALNIFSPLVTKGSYMVVEDGIINELGMRKKYKGGPQKAIKEFLRHSKDFEIDRSWIDFFGRNATFNQNGYLKKTGYDERMDG